MICPDTRKCLLERRTGSLRDLAAQLGLPANMVGTLADIINERHDHVSDRAENTVREALGLPRKPRVYAVPECPSCGGAPHVGDCQGKHVAKVVVLGPGERVRAARRAPTRWADYPVSTLRRIIRDRQPYGGVQDGQEEKDAGRVSCGEL